MNTWLPNEVARLQAAMHDGATCAALCRVAFGQSVVPDARVPGHVMQWIVEEGRPLLATVHDAMAEPRAPDHVIGPPPLVEERMWADWDRHHGPRRRRLRRDAEVRRVEGSVRGCAAELSGSAAAAGVRDSTWSTPLLAWGGLFGTTQIGRGMWVSTPARWRCTLPADHPLREARAFPVDAGPGLLVAALVDAVQTLHTGRPVPPSLGAAAWALLLLPLLAPTPRLPANPECGHVAPAWLTCWSLHALHPLVRARIVVMHALARAAGRSDWGFVATVLAAEGPFVASVVPRRQLRTALRRMARTTAAATTDRRGAPGLFCPIGGRLLRQRLERVQRRRQLGSVLDEWDRWFGGANLQAVLHERENELRRKWRVPLARIVDHALLAWEDPDLADDLACR